MRRALLCSQGPVLNSLDFYSQNSDDFAGEPSPNTVRIQFELGRQSLQEIQGIMIHEVLRLAKQDKEQAARYLHISTKMLDEQIRSLEEVSQGTKSS